MTGAAVSEAVRRGDPDRWRTAMLAPTSKRPGLMALYAFNLEIARAPWVASEPMLAAIRLRWWHDAIGEICDGAPPRRHEVVEPLAAAMAEGGLPRRLFDEMIAAREADAEGVRHADLQAVEDYLERTAGHLMELAARHLGASGAALPVVREFARGAGAAALLRALPELRARGRDPLPETLPPETLARAGLAALQSARARRDRVPREALPALLAGWQADRLLRRAGGERRDLEASPFRARAGLAWRALSGRW